MVPVEPGSVSPQPWPILSTKGNAPRTIRAKLAVLRGVFLISGRKAVGLRDLVVPYPEPQDPAWFLTLGEIKGLFAVLVEAEPAADFWICSLLVLTGHGGPRWPGC